MGRAPFEICNATKQARVDAEDEAWRSHRAWNQHNVKGLDHIAQAIMYL